MAAAELISFAGFALIVIGILIVVLALILSSNRSSGKAKVRGGGAVIIGPIPIVFGTDKKAVKTVLALSIVLTAIVLAITIVDYFLTR